MGYESTQRLQVEVDGGVLIIRLNRPEAMNAFDDELHRDFPRLLMEIEADTELRVVVLTGNGSARTLASLYGNPEGPEVEARHPVGFTA